MDRISLIQMVESSSCHVHGHVEFEGLGICPYTRNKLTDDQQFIHFWEKLSRKTKLIGLYITERSGKEFVWGVEDDYAYAGFLTKMWELLARKQMNFTDALRFVYNEDMYQSMFLWGTQFEPNLFPMERLSQDGDVHQLVMDTIVENLFIFSFGNQGRTMSMCAEEIGLIPKQPPHRLYVPGCYLR
ncbi:unnamed protein product [Miscanthus lutarioriparius]|uniref:Uncharacterized protein n=1 Tax=Miscanthus lutarioriparius TaxID=422564 RepID=A0A811MJJ4_9POAL|nr:unnamed protein product [Miscanthus lutarioriparius]